MSVATPLLESESAPSSASFSSSFSPVSTPETVRPRELAHQEAVRLEANLSLATESQLFAGLDGDVAHGGVFVETYRTLPVGTPVDLELELPEGPVSAAGCVRWVREATSGAPSGVGVELVIVSNRDRARIARFSRQRAPLYYEE